MEILAEDNIIDDSINEETVDEREKQYRLDIDNAIERIADKEERLIFFNVVKEADISNIKVFKYPALRNYVLSKIEEKKKELYIEKKINRIVKDIISKKGKVSFVKVLNRCNFSREELSDNPEITQKIKAIVIKESKNFYKKK